MLKQAANISEPDINSNFILEDIARMSMSSILSNSNLCTRTPRYKAFSILLVDLRFTRNPACSLRLTVVPIASSHSRYEEFPTKGRADPASIVVTCGPTPSLARPHYPANWAKNKIHVLKLKSCLLTSKFDTACSQVARLICLHVVYQTAGERVRDRQWCQIRIPSITLST